MKTQDPQTQGPTKPKPKPKSYNENFPGIEQFNPAYMDEMKRQLLEENQAQKDAALADMVNTLDIRGQQADLRTKEAKASLAERQLQQFGPPSPNGQDTGDETKYDPLSAALGDPFTAQLLASAFGQSQQATNQFLNSPGQAKLGNIHDTQLNRVLDAYTHIEDKSLLNKPVLGLPGALVGGILDLFSAPFGEAIGTKLLGGKVGQDNLDHELERLRSIDANLASQVEVDLHKLGAVNGLSSLANQDVDRILESRRDLFRTMGVETENKKIENEIMRTRDTYYSKMMDAIPTIGINSGDINTSRMWGGGLQGEGTDRGVAFNLFQTYLNSESNTNSKRSKEEYRRRFIDGYINNRDNGRLLINIEHSLPFLVDGLNKQFTDPPNAMATTAGRIGASSLQLAKESLNSNALVRFMDELRTQEQAVVSRSIIEQNLKKGLEEKATQQNLSNRRISFFPSHGR